MATLDQPALVSSGLVYELVYGRGQIGGNRSNQLRVLVSQLIPEQRFWRPNPACRAMSSDATLPQYCCRIMPANVAMYRRSLGAHTGAGHAIGHSGLDWTPSGEQVRVSNF